MRFVTAVQEREKCGDKQVEQVSRELWRRIWSEDKDITESASLTEVVAYFNTRGAFFFVLRFRVKIGSFPHLFCRRRRKQDCPTGRSRRC